MRSLLWIWAVKYCIFYLQSICPCGVKWIKRFKLSTESRRRPEVCSGVMWLFLSVCVRIALKGPTFSKTKRGGRGKAFSLETVHLLAKIYSYYKFFPCIQTDTKRHRQRTQTQSHLEIWSSVKLSEHHAFLDYFYSFPLTKCVCVCMCVCTHTGTLTTERIPGKKVILLCVHHLLLPKDWSTSFFLSPYLFIILTNLNLCLYK